MSRMFLLSAVALVLVWTSVVHALSSDIPYVEGEIRSLDLENNRLTIQHGPLPHLDMDMEMTMVFDVQDPVILEGLEEGQTIWFQVDRLDGYLTVISISLEPVEESASGDQSHGEEHGHGEGHEQGEHDGHGDHAAMGGEPATHYDYDRTIVIDVVDIEFDRATIDVKDGETVRFVIVNSGELEHEFNIGTPEMHAEHQEEMAEMMDALMDGKPMVHSHGNSVFLLPGETRVLVWKFEHAHDLEFACNVPGHYDAGMHGSFIFVH